MLGVVRDLYLWLSCQNEAPEISCESSPQYTFYLAACFTLLTLRLHTPDGMFWRLKPWGFPEHSLGKGSGDMGSQLAGTLLASPEAPFPLPGDILALVFGLLFAATSIAFLLQLRRQHRYLWPSLGTALFV